jgi:O-antigen ligase
VSAATLAAGTAEEAAASDVHDNWPHTKRPLPWMLAGFLVMVFLIPFDGIVLKVHLPVDSKPDRFALVLMAGVLLLKAATGSSKRPRRRTAVERALMAFAGVALFSVVLNIDRIYRLNQLSFAEKRLSQLLAYVLFFFIVVATVRTAEMAAFARLILVLTCLTAVGTLYEAHTGFNAFYVWSAKLLSSIASVIPSPTAIHPKNGGRPTIVGPTAHGLALTSMLTIALPFAVLPLLEARRLGKRLVYLVAIGLILAAQLATARKTAMIAPVAAFGVLMAYKRQLLRWAPVAVLVLVPVIHFAAPGALGTGGDLLANGGSASSSSTAGRVNDYSAVAPDVLSNLLIGRGYGTLDSNNLRWYRILDNEYLGELFQVGFVGLLAYLALTVSALATAHGVIRRGGALAPLALAAAAGCAAFGLVSATFDALAFPQAPYAFLFAAGLIAVAGGERAESEARGGDPTHRYLTSLGAANTGDGFAARQGALERGLSAGRSQ